MPYFIPGCEGWDMKLFLGRCLLSGPTNYVDPASADRSEKYFIFACAVTSVCVNEILWQHIIYIYRCFCLSIACVGNINI